MLRRLKQIFWNRKSNRDTHVEGEVAAPEGPQPAEGQAEVVGGGAEDVKSKYSDIENLIPTLIHYIHKDACYKTSKKYFCRTFSF